MNLQMKNKMYDLLIDKDFISMNELKEIGFTSDEIDELLKQRDILLSDNGYYTLGKISKFIFYSYYCYNNKNISKYRDILRAALRFRPKNYQAATLLFSESIIDKDYAKVLEYFYTMDSSDNNNNAKDCNFWLLLLGYIIELPVEYMDRISNLRVNDILINENNNRYSDSKYLNQIRRLVFEGQLNLAYELIESLDDDSKGKVYNKITRNLLILAKEKYRVDDNGDIFYDLVVDLEYLKLVKMLEDIQDRRRFTFSEFCLYTLSKNMVGMVESGRVPKMGKCEDINFVEAIVKHNYELALQINRCSNGGDNCSSSDAVSLMLQKIVDKKDELKLKRKAKNIGSNEFAKFYNSLMNNDIDMALLNLDSYLIKMNKREYYSYVFSLIKLSLVEEDRDYVEPILALSDIRDDKFSFDILTNLQGYYLSMESKDYKRAIAYLNILSSAKDIPGVISVDTSELESRFFSVLKSEDIKDSDIVVDIPKKKENILEEKTEDVVLEIIPEDKFEIIEEAKDNIADESVEENVRKIDVERYSGLSDVIDGINDGDNLVLLAPMNNEDTQNVLYLASCIPSIEVSLIDSVDSNDKHILLRYNSQNTNTNGSELIREGNSAYFEKRYEDCIECFENFVSGRGEPRSFVYAKLGLAYGALGTNEGYCNAIDYLTVATHKSNKYYDGDFDFTRIIGQLKDICGYNGVEILPNEKEVIDTSKIQYIKKS